MTKNNRKSASSKSTRTSTSKKSSVKKQTKKQKAAVKRHHLNPQMFLVPTVKTNPRRKGSFGFKSLAVILNSRKPMTVETATEKGARLRDINWDLNKGYLKLLNRANKKSVQKAS